MKVGDLVRLRKGSLSVGIAIDFLQKKCWRTHELGRQINWDIVEPEEHAVVFFGQEQKMTIPVIELEVVHECG